MRKLIIITGHLAAGKSTFGKILAQQFNLPFFSKDRIKELLCDRIGFKTREENLQLSVAALDIMFENLKELSTSGYDLILEANFHQGEMDNIEKLCLEHKYSILTLMITADESILHQRFITRLKNENRHIAHRSIELIDFSVFKNYLKTTQANPIGQILHINADDFSYQDNPKILNEIKSFLNS